MQRKPQINPPLAPAMAPGWAATWWTASRFPSLIKVLLPLAVGLGLGFTQNGEFRPVRIAAVLLFGWLTQLLIIFLNDFADAEADTHHHQRYPGLIDPRAIPHGWLKRGDILIAALTAIALLLLLSSAMVIFFDRPWAPVFAVGAVALLWMYSFAPMRLNYRGGGECLETIGVGGVLPWFGYYFYTGTLDLPILMIAPVLFLSFASSVSSGLKHQPADLDNGKHTAAVLLGSRPARLLIMIGLGASIAIATLLCFSGHYHPMSSMFVVFLPLYFGYQALREYPRADYHHLHALKKFKSAVHRAIYSTELGLLLSFVVFSNVD